MKALRELDALILMLNNVKQLDPQTEELKKATETLERKVAEAINAIEIETE